MVDNVDAGGKGKKAAAIPEPSDELPRYYKKRVQFNTVVYGLPNLKLS